MKTTRLRTLVVLAAVGGAIGVARANAPAGRFTVGTDVVTDNVTGLKWEKDVSLTFWDYASARDMYCAQLGKGGFASGWRLPTMKELLSITDIRARPLAIDTTAFPSATNPSGNYWASDAWATTDALYLQLPTGKVSEGAKSTGLRVRCVHD